jgi:hypothetical protein
MVGQHLCLSLYAIEIPLGSPWLFESDSQVDIDQISP